MDQGQGFGHYLDDPDRLFMWLNHAVFGVAAMNLANRSGVTARLIEGPAAVAELAAQAGIPADGLERVLDYLLAHGVVGRDGMGRYCATPRTAAMHAAAGYFANTETSTMAASRFLDGLRQGRVPFELAFGEKVFDHFATRPERAALFGEFMGWMTRRFTRFLFARHRFAPFGTVCDIGGSMGDLLLAVLAEYPGTRGVLFDLPSTVALASERLADHPLRKRIDLVGGSFFEAVPVADLYLMKQILHDWDDDQARAILAIVRRTIPAHGRLVVIDHILSDTPAPDEAQGTDIAMMIWASGRERKLSAFEALFAATGFAIARVSRNPNGHSAMEVIPV
ncbi:MAG: methyltransferase [Alteraurantiacibacter sp.]|nr:methyltransferase [Alteraurantiacibacter sp.]